MATSRIVLEDGTVKSYKDASVDEDGKDLRIYRYEEIPQAPRKAEFDPFGEFDDNPVVSTMIAHFPYGTWKYWEMVEEDEEGD